MGTSKSYITPTTKEYSNTKRSVTKAVKNYSQNAIASHDIDTVISRFANNLTNEKTKKAPIFSGISDIFKLLYAIQVNESTSWIESESTENIQNKNKLFYQAALLRNKKAQEKAKEFGFTDADFENPLKLFNILIHDDEKLGSIEKDVLTISMFLTLKELDIITHEDLKNVDIYTFFNTLIINILIKIFQNRYGNQILDKLETKDIDELNAFNDLIAKYIRNHVKSITDNTNMDTSKNILINVDFIIDKIFNSLKKLGAL